MLRWRELTFVFLLSILVAAQGVNSSSFFDGGYKVMTYWGQNSANGAGTQKNLASYCDDSSDVLIMSFITEFNVGGLPTLNLASACEKTYFDGTNLLKCPQVANDIKTCQGQGKKVLLSLGGASGSYGFSNDGDGKKFAQTLWDLFLGGNSSTRPFGDVAIDGFDLDIEAGGSTGYVAFIEELRQLFESDSSKEYYITAAPQCPFPDAMLGSVIDNANVDALNVQFYNNFCSVSSSSFNFDQWADWAKTKSPNKDVKIFLGVPGSSSAAGSGFTPASQLQSVIQKLKSSDASVFGGVTVWDASQSYSSDFASAIAGDVHGGSSPSSSSKKSRKNKNKSKRWRLFDQLRR